VSIGATLAAARRRAGLTVGDVSDRTRVREAIISGIERDDYAACGGDFYARGHIRAIARAVGEDPDPLIGEFDSTWGSARELTAAEAFRPVMPLRARERRRVRWTAALAVVVLAVLGLASYMFAAHVGGPAQHGTATAARQHSRAPGGPSAQAQSAAVSAPATRASSSPPPSPSPSPTPTVALAPATVTAFGPGGTGDGDNPRHASLALGGDPGRPWRSSWYTTPHFGNLQDGTGLLVDMGRTVKVSSVRVWLGNSGADLELRVGRVPTLAGLPRKASAYGAGGTVRFRLAAPVPARYVLIWFTRLPPDSAGTYQASVWRIDVQGLRLPSRHEP
jgi:Helix-turn-helix domain